jgi:LPS export ABC transporter permease LptG/LPS export ABC transporter permease LptF
MRTIHGMPGIRLLSRSVLREIWPPFALGFAAYTFILLVRTIYFLADFFVRRSAGFGEVAWLVLLSVPWIIVLTLPMAFLLGVLIGVGRLSADSEIIAMRSCGVGSGALFRPILAAGAVLSIGVFLIYNFVLPGANDRLTRSMARVAATSVVNIVQPRVFREVRPGLTLFFDRASPDGRGLQGIFLKLGEEYEPDNRVIVARSGALSLEGDNLWLDLFDSALHDYDKDNPARYRMNFNQTQRILMAGDLWNSPAAQISYEKSLRAQSLKELLQTAGRVRTRSVQNYRLAWVEIHKKFSIPIACLVFAVLGIPLAESSRRGGKGSGFAISLAIIVVYYILLSGGETWAEEGKIRPALAMWMPNLVLLVLGLAAIVRSRRERARWRWVPGEAGAETAPSALAEPRPRFTGWLRFPGILDRYILRRFFLMLLLVSVSVLLLAVIVDYADHIDKIARNHPSASVLLGYYRYFLLSIGVQVAPFAVLLATLISLGILSKNNEDTAFRASGVSLHRLSVAILIAAGLGAVFQFTLGEYVLPFAEQRETRFRNIIYGRPPDYGLRSPAERNWHYESDGSIWHREASDPERGTQATPTVFEFGPGFELTRRIGAKQADWNGEAWVFRQGWVRTFGNAAETSYRTFLEERVAGDAPPAFTQEVRTPEQMRFRELQRYAERLRASGYPTGRLETALQTKLATPLLLPLMVLLAIPFAFRIGKRGTLAGVGVGLGLGMAFTIAAAFFTKLGEVGVLPPVLAAWSPNVLSATGAAYFSVRLRT